MLFLGPKFWESFGNTRHVVAAVVREGSKFVRQKVGVVGKGRGKGVLGASLKC